MKKFFMFICTLVFTFVLVGCNQKVVDPENYTIDKEIEIKEELSLEQAQAKFDEVDDESDDAKYLTMDIKMVVEGINIDMKMILVHENNVLNGSITTKSSYGSMSQTVEMYVKDNYILMDLGLVGGKKKVEIPAGEEIEADDLGAYDINEMIEEFFKEADKQSENFKAGYDANGCLVLDYNETNMKARFVFDKNYPVYFYAAEGSSTKMEFKFTYTKTEVKFPESLNLDDYQTISWDEYNGGIIM